MKEFKIDGCIMLENHPQDKEWTEQEVWEKFIDFVEENGWNFAGVTELCEEEE